MLTSFLPSLKHLNPQKNNKGQKAVLKNAANAVSKSRDLREDNVTELPKDLPNVCPFYSSYNISMALKLVFIYRPSLDILNYP